MKDVLTSLQGDFKLFLQALWDQLDLPSPTRAQYAIADYLQSGPKRLQIQAFRGVGKSWITGAFVLWTLFNDAEKKIMIISASKERADNIKTDVKSNEGFKLSDFTYTGATRVAGFGTV